MPYTQFTRVVNGANANATTFNQVGENQDLYIKLYEGEIESIRQGWIPVTTQSGGVAVAETWTYASVSGILGTITIPSGGTTRFQKGDKIRFVQSATTKYFYVTSVTSTTLVVTGGTDFTLTNNPITDIYLSRVENPFGFPDSFNDWLPLTLENSWVNYGAPFSTAGYRIDPITSLVIIKGLIKSGTATAGASVATLPVGYRPSETLYTTTQYTDGVAPKIGIIQLGSDGRLVLGGTIGNVWLQLDNIRFYPR